MVVNIWVCLLICNWVLIFSSLPQCLHCGKRSTERVSLLYIGPRYSSTAATTTKLFRYESLFQTNRAIYLSHNTYQVRAKQSGVARLFPDSIGESFFHLKWLKSQPTCAHIKYIVWRQQRLFIIEYTRDKVCIIIITCSFFFFSCRKYQIIYRIFIILYRYKICIEKFDWYAASLPNAACTKV